MTGPQETRESPRPQVSTCKCPSHGLNKNGKSRGLKPKRWTQKRKTNQRPEATCFGTKCALFNPKATMCTKVQGAQMTALGANNSNGTQAPAGAAAYAPPQDAHPGALHPHMDPWGVCAPPLTSGGGQWAPLPAERKDSRKGQGERFERPIGAANFGQPSAGGIPPPPPSSPHGAEGFEPLPRKWEVNNFRVLPLSLVEQWRGESPPPPTPPPLVVSFSSGGIFQEYSAWPGLRTPVCLIRAAAGDLVVWRWCVKSSVAISRASGSSCCLR